MPKKYAVLPRVEEETERGAERGQIIVMFALFLVAMMGVLGLATDVGYSMAAKRSVQGAADSGAMAGARMIARYTTAAPTSALSEVTTVVQKNTFGPVTPTVLSCEYIGNNWSVVGTCNQNVPANAAGARVKTRATYKTWFIRVLPGAPKTVTVGGYAKARVQSAAKSLPDAPFIVCGINSWDVTSNPTGKGASVGTNLSILASTSPMKINPAAVGHTFRVHDPSLDQKGNADCSSQADRFKGLSKQSANAGKTAGSWFTYDTGDKAGPTQTKVEGVEGCAADTDAPYDCVMVLPIATNSPAESGNSKQVYVVGFAAFYVTTVDSNSHNAKLLDDYIMPGAGTDTWCRDCGGTVVIRLIW
ncbi:MAG TPA: TadE/TadG family type IV pilus assembly protein [Thermomicrobiales bacterium]|jgi:Flp pilus assembly protein TadG